MRITIQEAAKILRISEQGLRLWIASGKCPFGIVINENKSRKTYWVGKEKLYEFIGTNKSCPEVAATTQQGIATKIP